MNFKAYIVPLLLLLVIPVLPWTHGWNVGAETCNSVFGAVGVIFSVQMSLIIAFNTKGVSDMAVKKKLRKDMSYIRDVILGYFLLSFVGLLLLKHVPECFDMVIRGNKVCIWINMRLGYILFIAWYIIVLLYNFLQIHQNYEKLEDAE